MSREYLMECPQPSVRRLPLYLSFLHGLDSEPGNMISSTRIADELGLTGIQVRKDLASTGVVGRPKIGYVVKDLIQHLETFLGWDNTKEALLVGAGHLGMALMGYRGFLRHGLRILAAFDADSDKVGMKVGSVEVFPLAKFENLARRLGVKIGIITVPGSVAQETADMMVNAGIQGIWNFSPTNIIIPSQVVIENVSLSSSLAVLYQKLTQKSEER